MAGNQIFTFDSSRTIGDLLLVAEQLKATGRTPTLHFVKSYAHELTGVEVHADDKEPGQYWPTPRPGLEKEMAVTEGGDDLPDPAEPSMRERVIGVVNGNRARAGLLMLNAYEPDPRD